MERTSQKPAHPEILHLIVLLQIGPALIVAHINVTRKLIGRLYQIGNGNRIERPFSAVYSPGQHTITSFLCCVDDGLPLSFESIYSPLY